MQLQRSGDNKTNFDVPRLSVSDATELEGLVSVVTATHNEARHIRRVVESVAAQTVPVKEHIIVNDGSTDGTATILEELQAEYDHLVVISQARCGAAPARNRGIAVARARYIAFLDADDVWHERKNEHQVRFMEDERCLFSYSDYQEVGWKDRLLVKRYHLPESVGHTQLLRGCPIGCLTVAYNQEILGKHYMPEVRSGHDWGLWLALTRTGLRARKVPGVEASYSNGRLSLSSKKFAKMVHVYEIYRNGERLSRPRAIFRTVEHSVTAVAKKAGLLYG